MNLVQRDFVSKQKMETENFIRNKFLNPYIGRK